MAVLDLHTVTDAQVADIGLRHNLIAAVLQTYANLINLLGFMRTFNLVADERAACRACHRRGGIADPATDLVTQYPADHAAHHGTRAGRISLRLSDLDRINDAVRN